ncbi:unnamed protein product [Pieris macdunnoughi]|uniref:Peptidase M12A domain-containing protein n=1 Tax=Pieris macdunnoughi TaxID=345717 RepID=A0A821QMX6_9NEOP|nr:unnamed protein product [Pieris macdunnoughi]
MFANVQCCDINGTNENLPPLWPCQWNNGIIPYTFNYYSISPKRLISIVKKGIDFIERRSCLKFIEHNPLELVDRKNFTFLFYNYSDVLESCCMQFYTIPFGKRQVVITPICTLPAEVAHTTLHAMGLTHVKHERFSLAMVDAALFPVTCGRNDEA